MELLLGVDLGSTSLKAIVYDQAGHVVASASRPTEKCHPSAEHPNWTVWQPEQIWEGTAAAIREAVTQLADPGAIRGLAVTGMGMDGLPIDSSGAPLYPMISWHDPRTMPQFEWWLSEIGAAATFAIGGNPVWPINSALRIRWMAENEPDLLARADRWLLIEDFMNFKLCGRMVTDYSMASCTMLFDQQTLTWSDELLQRSGVAPHLLCEALPSGSPIGEVTEDAAQATGLPAGTPVVLGGHDHLTGALPVGAFQAGVALNVTGTWETILATSDAPVLRDELRQAGMTVQAHVARGRHAIWGGSVAGEMLEWIRGQLAPEERQTDWATLMEEADAAPVGCGGAMFLPHMSGAASPIVDSKSLGAFVGLNTRASRGDLVRSVVEGLNFQALDMIAAIEASLGRPLEQIVAVGGGTRNAFWMQNKADVVGRPIQTTGIEEATPLGAAIMAGIGVGMYDDEEHAFEQVRRVGVTYQPDESRTNRYRQLVEIHHELYERLRPIHHTIFEEFRT